MKWPTFENEAKVVNGSTSTNRDLHSHGSGQLITTLVILDFQMSTTRPAHFGGNVGNVGGECGNVDGAPSFSSDKRRLMLHLHIYIQYMDVIWCFWLTAYDSKMSKMFSFSFVSYLLQSHVMTAYVWCYLYDWDWFFYESDCQSSWCAHDCFPITRGVYWLLLQLHMYFMTL